MTTPAPGKRRRFRLPILRWLRKGRVLLLLLFASGVFFFMVSPIARRVPALHALFDKLERAENSSYDLRFQWRGTEAPDPRVAILAISKPFIHAEDVRAGDLEKSPALRAMGEKEFPWRREVWVETLDKLFAAGARVVAFDVVFAAKNQDDPAFAAALEKYAGRVVLAMTVQNISPDPNDSKLQVFYPNPAILSQKDERVIGCALVHQETDDDQTVRRVDHFTSELRELGIPDETDQFPSLSALAVEKFLGKRPEVNQRQFVRYQGGLQTYPYFALDEIFDSVIYPGPRFRNGEVFRDKIVFIGATYELAHDDKMTPFGKMAGVEVHAQAAADLLNGAPLETVSFNVAWWITLALTFVSVAVISAIHRAWAQVAVLVATGGAYVFATHLGFSVWNRVLPMAAPLLGLAITGAFGVVVMFAVEQWEKAQTRKVLNRSVNPRIAKVLLRNAESFDQSRRGKRQPVAILFSDIRSFTTWSESAEPENLVGQLNEYFERMVALIEAEDCLGNAQKFIGDAILAAWGDTPENSFGPAEDARRAIATALKMRSALKDLNAGWEGRPDRIVISIGIGINSGDVVVGEVGHPDRGEYTVLGDGVNFAARLESATKQFHTDCLVGERAEELTRDHFVFRHVDYLKVKGKTKPVNVYTLISDRTVPPPAWLADYHRARAMYVDRKFPEAAALFRDVKIAIGGEDFLCDRYAERCDLYAVVPPAADWDGSYTMTDK